MLAEPFSNYPTPDYNKFIALSRYARYLDEEHRRESWTETVSRYMDFMEEHLLNGVGYTLSEDVKERLRRYILTHEVMPSMRCLMTAGPALARCNVAGFNCSYLPIDHPRAFDEMLYILMCGVGVGFSVEKCEVKKLPIIAEEFEDTDTTIVVEDSKEGWAKALRQLLSLLWVGQVPKWDTSKLRAAGARLHTFGGRSSGPEPLEDLFRFCVETFTNAAGRQLNSLECHDIACKIGDIVVVGGVRRSALISLSDIEDIRMRHAKSGEWYNTAVHRQLANNSAVYLKKPDSGLFMDEWLSLYRSKSGERGIYNREATWKHLQKNVTRRKVTYNDNGIKKNVTVLIPFGCNPCSEIILRPYQFCNLTEVVIRATDTFEDIRFKVVAATILGTFQSTLTNFKYLRKIWQKNTEEERLLGVSLTGIMDNPIMAKPNPRDLEELRDLAVQTNKEWAEILGIPQSAAVTCVKPSGTVSQLVNSSSGIHPRHSEYYIRGVRQDRKDPVSQLMIDQGVPYEQDRRNPETLVFYFPQKSPEGALTRNDISAIDQLELWKKYQEHWCEHKPSCTVYIRENEWMEVGAWVFENFDLVSGISFFPFSEHTYPQAPFTECTKEEYEAAVKKFPKTIDWSKLPEYETEDATTGSQELACHGGVCEI